MKRTIVADEPCAQPCADCTVRAHAICAALEQDELRELEQLGQRLQYRPHEPVFTRKILPALVTMYSKALCAFTSCYLMAAGRSWDLPCPEISSDLRQRPPRYFG